MINRENEDNKQIMNARLDYEQKRVDVLSELAENYIFEYDQNIDTLKLNRSIELDGQKVNEVCGCTNSKNWVRYIHPDDIKKVMKLFKTRENGEIEIRGLTKSGYQWYKVTFTERHIGDHNVVNYFGSLTNIDTVKTNTLWKEHLLHCDSVTKLYTLDYMKSEIEKVLEKEKEDKHALLLIDLVEFEKINQEYGYMYGDSILVQTSYILKKVFYQSKLIGRVGSNMFMIFINHMQERERLFPMVDAVCTKLANIYTSGKNDCIKAMFGIATYPSDGTTFTTLFQHADTACYVAKNRGYGNFMFYENCALHLKEEKELYEQYGINTSSKKFCNYFNKDVTTTVIELMKNVRDTKSSITLILNYLNNLLNTDAVRVYEKVSNINALVLRYTSGPKHRIQEKNKIFYHENDFGEYEKVFTDGFFAVNNTKDIKNLQLKQSFYEQGIHATLQYAIYQENEFLGCIAIEDLKKEHTWTQYEYSALYSVATIYSTYLLKIREYEEIKQKYYFYTDCDSVTKLPDFLKFRKVVEEILRFQMKPEKRYAIVTLNFMDFKYVNEQFGIEKGNQILFEYARTLELISENLIVAREISDQFMVLAEVDDIEQYRILITDINEEFTKSQKKYLNLWKMNIIAGICEITSPNDVIIALEKAEVARKSSKDIYRTSSIVYDYQMDKKIQRQYEIIQSQENALRNSEFKVYLQPKIELENNRLVGAEALIRWKRNDGNIMFPDEFIPIFEQNGFIQKIDFFVYETVCKLLNRWKKEKRMQLPISVNVSRLHLLNDNFVNEFCDLVEGYEIDTNLLELELTETMVLSDVKAAVDMMKRFQEKGFLVSIDDFGSGYSSLNLLKDLKTDILKLDREFFRTGELRQTDKIIVSSIINMAKQLNMKVISEGVETSTQSEFLKDIQCDMVQGYFYAKPMPIPEFEKFVENYSPKK